MARLCLPPPPYNRPMRTALSALVPLLLASAPALAQVPGAESAPAGRPGQQVERIVHEDAGSRIEETRYGGQTQSITVQPKAGLPAYEIQPADLARTRPADSRDGMGSAAGQRYWNVFRF
jgi:hypothetical protein